MVYNGLDRIDSFKTHDLDNVRTCCSTCNYAKLQMTTVEFTQWLTEISANFLFEMSKENLQKIIILYTGDKL